MTPLDASQSRELLLRVVNRFFEERHSPLPGAFVKAQMLAEAQWQGNVFSERHLGFHKFIEFIRSVPDVAIQGRSGSDVLLAPAGSRALLAAYATPLPRLRRDFWRAFIEFPVEGTVRLYDLADDKIVYDDFGTTRSGIAIEPVSRDTQLQWRRIFAEEQPESVRSTLLQSLDQQGTAAFNEFARRLREIPPVMKAWNRYLQKQITEHVANWAAANGVPEERWLALHRQGLGFSREDQGSTPARPTHVSQRAELYNLLDQLAVEDLLELRVPLGWLLKISGRVGS